MPRKLSNAMNGSGINGDDFGEADAFSFFRSYFEAIEEIPEEAQLEAYRALVQYGLNGTPPPSDASPFTKMLIRAVLPVLAKSRVRSMAGKRGAAASNQTKRSRTARQQSQPGAIAGGTPSGGGSGAQTSAPEQSEAEAQADAGAAAGDTLPPAEDAVTDPDRMEHTDGESSSRPEPLETGASTKGFPPPHLLRPTEPLPVSGANLDPLETAEIAEQHGTYIGTPSDQPPSDIRPGTVQHVSDNRPTTVQLPSVSGPTTVQQKSSKSMSEGQHFQKQEELTQQERACFAANGQQPTSNGTTCAQEPDSPRPATGQQEDNQRPGTAQPTASIGTGSVRHASSKRSQDKDKDKDKDDDDPRARGGSAPESGEHAGAGMTDPALRPGHQSASRHSDGVSESLQTLSDSDSTGDEVPLVPGIPQGKPLTDLEIAKLEAGGGPLSEVMTLLRNRISPQPSPLTIRQVSDFVRDMGKDCVIRAIQITIEQPAERRNWGYARGILLRKQAEGVRSLEDWDRSEAKRLERLGYRGPDSRQGRPAEEYSTGGSFATRLNAEGARKYHVKNDLEGY